MKNIKDIGNTFSMGNKTIMSKIEFVGLVNGNVTFLAIELIGALGGR